MQPCKGFFLVTAHLNPWSQKADTIEMLLRPYLPSLKNLRALAGLKGMLGQTWSQIVQNGLDMAPTWP